MVVVGEDRGARQQRRLGARRQLGDRGVRPCARVVARDGGPAVGALVQQAAAETLPLVGQDHPGRRTRGRQRCGQAGRPGADHQPRRTTRCAARTGGSGAAGRAAQAGGVADHLLVGHPHRRRPHEGLVVEAGREQRRQPVVHHADIAVQRRPAVLALRDQAVMERDGGRAHVRIGRGLPRVQLDQRVRLLRPRGQDAARSVVLEAAADHMDAVRQQGGGQRVAASPS